MSFKSELRTLKKKWDTAAGHPRLRHRIRARIKAVKQAQERYFALWGGSRRIINEEVIPVAKRYGVSVTSRKRSASDPLSLANPDSDHNKANKEADAADLGTYNGSTLARAIAHSLGISNYSTGNFNSYYIVRRGVQYRVQILWAVEGHFDHVHVGIRRV